METAKSGRHKIALMFVCDVSLMVGKSPWHLFEIVKLEHRLCVRVHNYQVMADCLTLLRQYNLQKKEIVERDELIIFDQIAWSRNAKTNYLTYRFTVYQWSREVASP